MAQTTIVLADLDAEYLAKLEKSFLDEFGHTAQLSIITDPGYLAEYFTSPRTLDILVINGGLYDQGFAKHNIAHLFLLCEEPPSAEGGAEHPERLIYKYSSAKEVLDHVISRSGISHSTKLRAGVAKVLAVYSPVGGAGQTTLAAGLCAVFSRNFRRALYVNLSGLQDFGFLLRGGQRMQPGVEKTLAAGSQYAYSKVKPLIASEFYDILPPFPASLASLGLAPEHFMHLLEQIKHSGDYDYIVLDTGAGFTADTARWMAYADHVVLVTLVDALSHYKLKVLLQNIDTSDHAKYLLVCNRCTADARLTAETVGAALPPAEYIAQDPALDPRESEALSASQGLQKLGQLYL